MRALEAPNAITYKPHASFRACPHPSVSTTTRADDWARVRSCDLCGAVFQVIEHTPDTRPTERTAAYRALRTAYHARQWR